jgi:rSAM/selenodomain-associated transferase 2
LQQRAVAGRVNPVAAAEAVRLSVIIPALNEAPGIVALLQSLQPLRRRGHEVIVVDGGSTDSTLALAAPLSDRTLATPRGRALQMQAGASEASGDVLWFLHADSSIPPHADRLIAVALQSPAAQWGRFDVALAGAGRLLRLVAYLMNLRARLSGIVTGDQGLFVRRELFARSGGFPPIPLMEDIALSRVLKRKARPAVVPGTLTTSARRWQRHGTLRTILTMWLLRFGYWLGLRPQLLARYYRAHGS